ncbi:hypothetical protein RJ641_025006 [Dillenia turbinata]|uniref:Uncharacterized protein n=1 Tax=Dillenia turbinata TaxID=194707 RepID=A0AAN8ZJP2_9MAGN
MAKKKEKIDQIPKYSQQPRSPAPKRRTDFSLFSQGFTCCRGTLSRTTASCLNNGKDNTRETSNLPFFHCRKSWDEGKNYALDSIKFPVLEVESVAQNALTAPCVDRSTSNLSDTAETLYSTPTKLEVTECHGICTSPGSMNCSNTSCQMRHPSNGLSTSNHLSSCRQSIESPDGSNNSNLQDQESEEKCNSSSSGRLEALSERGRGKRKPKPKIYFDEETFSMPARKVRRFKIMRSLGLTAPVGSPYSPSHVRVASEW